MLNIGWETPYATDCTMTPTGWNVNPPFQMIQRNVRHDNTITYTITCTGPWGGPVGNYVTVNVVAGQQPLTVTCEPWARGAPRSVTYRTRSNPQARVDWTATSNGTDPQTYTWTFDPRPTTPEPSPSPQPPYQNTSNRFSVTYGFDGEMEARVSVRDATGRTTASPVQCSPITVQYLDIIEGRGQQP